MVEGAGLENRWALAGLVGSNPTLSVVSPLPAPPLGGPGAPAARPAPFAYTAALSMKLVNTDTS